MEHDEELAMSQAKVQFLNLRYYPARLTTAQTAALLGVKPRDLAPLMEAGILKTLSVVGSNTVKYFAAVEILRLREDVGQLRRLTQFLNRYWAKKNADRQDQTETAFQA